jgi:plastocyanin
VLFALLLAVVLAACGTSSSGGAAGAGSSGSGSASSGHTVTIKGFAFHPSTLTVHVGAKVTFTNEDSTTHNATSSGTSTIDSGSLPQGHSYTVTFTKPGTYNYICTIHPYMKATVIVK